MRIILLSSLLTLSLFGQHRSGAPAAAPPRPRPAPPVSLPLRTYPRIYSTPYVAVPYPIYLGGGYYNAPPAAYDNGYVDQTPPAVVNQNFQADGGTPTLVDYSNVSLPEAAAAPPDADAPPLKDDQPTIFLIALTDHTVVAAIAYWVDGDTLNWISREAKQNRMSLSLVDRDFSKQLNDERHVEFKLPAPK
jgi:hypothetical protein